MPTFESWAAGEPPAGAKDCAATGDAGLWTAHACGEAHPFVCEHGF